MCFVIARPAMFPPRRSRGPFEIKYNTSGILSKLLNLMPLLLLHYNVFWDKYECSNNANLCFTNSRYPAQPHPIINNYLPKAR